MLQLLTLAPLRRGLSEFRNNRALFYFAQQPDGKKQTGQKTVKKGERLYRLWI